MSKALYLPNTSHNWKASLFRDKYEEQIDIALCPLEIEEPKPLSRFDPPTQAGAEQDHHLLHRVQLFAVPPEPAVE
jgi:hypothetical protein